MAWTFEGALTVVFALILMGQLIASRSRFYLTLPFVLGVLSIGGLQLGLFPENLVAISQMKGVGFVAFTLLVVHSGTGLRLKDLKHSWKLIIYLIGLGGILLGSSLLVGLFFGSTKMGIIGFPSIFGGGAVAAIASVATRGHSPEWTMLPWIVFMLQGLLIQPLLVWFGRRGRVEDCSNVDLPVMKPENEAGIARDARRYKWMCWFNGLRDVPAYTIFMICLVVLFAKWATSMVPVKLPHVSVVLLVLGALMGHIGLLKREPLYRTQTMGLLMPGLMALMVDGFSGVPMAMILGLLFRASVLLVSGLSFAMLYAKYIGGLIFEDQSEGYLCILAGMAGYGQIHEIFKAAHVEVKPEFLIANKWIGTGVGITCAAMIQLL